LQSAYFRRRLAQAIPAQAILSPDRHRQARGFLGAPARACQAAGEFRSAAGTGETAGAGDFQPICHQPNRIFTHCNNLVMSGSCPALCRHPRFCSFKSKTRMAGTSSAKTRFRPWRIE
jgi:hypothetical protein